jgi:hypothetical protein
MTQIVSIVDANPVNQNALRLFIKSFEKYSTMPLKSLLVLYPKDRLNFNFIHWLKRKNIQTESYSLTSEDGDPYKAKFLLMDYIRSCKDNKDDVLYIDPDHIFLKDFSFKPQDDVLIVSSEVKDGWCRSSCRGSWQTYPSPGRRPTPPRATA